MSERAAGNDRGDATETARGTRVETPRLDALLERLQSVLRRNVWLHGLGTVVAAAALWLVFMYVADRALKLPGPIRIFHALVLVGGTVFLLRRTLLRPIRSVPDRAGLAMLAQRALPDDVPREDLFVSAVQLPESVPAGTPARELVASVTQRAEELTGSANLSRVSDPTGPRGRLAAALGATAIATIAFATEPAMSAIFFDRVLGADVPWPRATTLVTEIPDDAPGLDVSRPEQDVVLVRAARGSDVPLRVRAIGEVPPSVTATFSSGAAIEIAPSGPDTFRTVLPSIQEATSVRVRGGDDDRGVPEIRIEVLQPPDITGLVFAIDPPQYTGLPTRLEEETKVSVVAGSKVTVFVEADPADATGVARTFPDDRILDLQSSPLPVVAPVGENEQEATEPKDGLAFSTTADQSLRFRIELRDSSGLENPDPALFGIEVVPDRRPELLTLAPGRAEAEVVETGAIPLRVLARDDFGLADIALVGSDPTTNAVLSSRTLVTRDAPEALENVDGRSRVAKLASEVLEVQGLFPDGDASVGRMAILVTEARDSRAPEPNETRSSPLLVRVVSTDEFLRGQRDGLSAAAEAVERLDRRLEGSGRTLADFVASVSGDDAEVPDAARLVSTANDARRLQGDVRSIARDLSGLAGEMVYSRLDVRSSALEKRLTELTSRSSERSFQEDAWRTIAEELERGALGAPERAGDLVRIVGLALEACGPRSDAWIGALEGVRAASGLEETRAALARAEAELAALRETMDRLTGELGEWDSLQSILSLTRDILSRQKNLKERTRKTAEDGR
ncbi:MAG: hypothetical protein AAGA20_17610 [Planctomycetota bacterium]